MPAVYRREIRHTYRDPQRTGRRGRPPLVPTPGVGLTQVVKQHRQGRVVGVEVRTVLGEPVAFPYLVHRERPERRVARPVERLDAQNACLCQGPPDLGCTGDAVFVRTQLAAAAFGVAGAGRRLAPWATLSTADAGHGHRLDQSCLELGRILDFQTLPLPREVTTRRSSPRRQMRASRCWLRQTPAGKRTSCVFPRRWRRSQGSTRLGAT